MNFVIFPMFFASSALYPIWRVQEASPFLYYVCQFNPLTHAVELIRFALHGKLNLVSFGSSAVAGYVHGCVHSCLRSVARPLWPSQSRIWPVIRTNLCTARD